MKLQSHEARAQCNCIRFKCEVQRRKVRKNEKEAQYAYFLQYSTVQREGVVADIPVCYKAVISIHVITNGELQFLQKSFKEQGIFLTTSKNL